MCFFWVFGFESFEMRSLGVSRKSLFPTPKSCTDIPQAAFDERVKAAVCFFATDIHSASLGKNGDDSLEKVRNGILSGPEKAELVVRLNHIITSA